MLGEGRVIVESDGLAEGRMDPAEHDEHDGYGLGGGFSSQPRGPKSFSSPAAKRSCNACVASSAPCSGKVMPIWPIPTA